MEMFFAILLSVTGTLLVSCGDQSSFALKESKIALVTDEKEHPEAIESTSVASNAPVEHPLEDQAKKVEKYDAPLSEDDIETNKIEDSPLDKKAKREIEYIIELRKNLCPPWKAPFGDLTILLQTGIINVLNNCREFQFYPSGEIYTFSGPWIE